MSAPEIPSRGSPPPSAPPATEAAQPAPSASPPHVPSSAATEPSTAVSVAPSSSSPPSSSQSDPPRPPPPRTPMARPGHPPQYGHLPPAPSSIQRGSGSVPSHGSLLTRPPQPFSTYGSPQLGMLPRSSPLTAPDPSPSSSAAQVRQPIQGIQTIGMIGSLSAASHLHPTGIPAQFPPRPGQLPLRAGSPATNQSLSTQKFPSHGVIRGSVPSSSSTPVSTLNSQPSHHQLMVAQGKPIHGVSMASSSYRALGRSHMVQQRPGFPQQHLQSPSSNLQQLQMASTQQQQQRHQLQLQQTQQQHIQEHNSQQQMALRNLQSQPSVRGIGSGALKSNVQPTFLSNNLQARSLAPIASSDTLEDTNQIVSKQSIRELVTQIDPSEKLDPEVEDVLVEIVDDFVESITTFACSLAKHRKSTTLEAKDILLHVERNWNMILPGCGGDEVKFYKKQFMNDIHKERLAAVKKSMTAASDPINQKNPSAGQGTTNTSKGHSARTHAISSPKT